MPLHRSCKRLARLRTKIRERDRVLPEAVKRGAISKNNQQDSAMLTGKETNSVSTLDINQTPCFDGDAATYKPPEAMECCAF
jgi:hypothetical protein